MSSESRAAAVSESLLPFGRQGPAIADERVEIRPLRKILGVREHATTARLNGRVSLYERIELRVGQLHKSQLLDSLPPGHHPVVGAQGNLKVAGMPMRARASQGRAAEERVAA